MLPTMMLHQHGILGSELKKKKFIHSFFSIKGVAGVLPSRLRPKGGLKPRTNPQFIKLLLFQLCLVRVIDLWENLEGIQCRNRKDHLGHLTNSTAELYRVDRGMKKEEDLVFSHTAAQFAPSPSFNHGFSLSRTYVEPGVK